MNVNYLAFQIRKSLSKHPQVLAAYLFGSVAKGKDRRCRELDLSSDIDIGILLDFSQPLAKRWDWWEKLHQEVGNNLRQELDLVILNGAPLGLVHQILRTGKRVYEKPGRRHRPEEALFLMEALDFLPVKELIENKAIERVKAYHG